MAVLAGLVALAQPTTGHANLITNGGFEVFVPSNGTGGGWTSTLIDGAGGWRATGGNPAGNFILNEAGSASDPTISQTVSGLAIGGLYRLEGDVACGNICNGSGLSFGALLDGTAILQRTTPAIGAPYQHFTVDFTATSASHVIAFAGERNGIDQDPRIDNITLDRVITGPVGVAEPASVILLGSALAAVAGLSYRRRRRS